MAGAIDEKRLPIKVKIAATISFGTLLTIARVKARVREMGQNPR
jgi:hypothetical protein